MIIQYIHDLDDLENENGTQTFVRKTRAKFTRRRKNILPHGEKLPFD